MKQKKKGIQKWPCLKKLTNDERKEKLERIEIDKCRPESRRAYQDYRSYGTFQEIVSMKRKRKMNKSLKSNFKSEETKIRYAEIVNSDAV